MFLAEKGFIPHAFAAVIRIAAVPRALVAFEQSAVGPSKDCAYEGPYLKAITGMPISMEGKTVAGAHLSHVEKLPQPIPGAMNPFSKLSYCQKWHLWL